MIERTIFGVLCSAAADIVGRDSDKETSLF